MSFWLVPKSVILNDLEWRNVHYFALFHRIWVASGAHCVKVQICYLISWWVLDHVLEARRLCYATDCMWLSISIVTQSYNKQMFKEIRGHRRPPASNNHMWWTGSDYIGIHDTSQMAFNCICEPYVFSHSVATSSAECKCCSPRKAWTVDSCWQYVTSFGICPKGTLDAARPTFN